MLYSEITVAIALSLPIAFLPKQTVNPASLISSSDLIRPSNSRLKTATVINHIDGDTVYLVGDKTLYKVRLACIDAPERKQKPWGKKATNRLKQIIPLKSTVKWEQYAVDRYSRPIGELFVNGQSINAQMVTEGHAFVYRPYLYNCVQTKQEMLEGELWAKEQKRGVWGQNGPQEPWQFRRRLN